MQVPFHATLTVYLFLLHCVAAYERTKSGSQAESRRSNSYEYTLFSDLHLQWYRPLLELISYPPLVHNPALSNFQPNMAAVVFEEMRWSEGERKVQQLMKVPYHDNPTVPMLSGGAATLLSRSPLLAVGAVDKDGKVWSSLWGGEPGFARGIPQLQNHIALRVPVDSQYDPVVEALMGPSGNGSDLRGKMFGGLAIDLESRRRVKLFGRVAAGALGQTELDEREVAELQLIVGIEQSLGVSALHFSDDEVLCADFISRLPL
jgi:hypothetical protein